MSQEKNNEAQGIGQFEPEKELVGDTLRKERITRRITVETIAKDLKLNVKYIKALESNEYGNLPADPYVRVYLKSLAKYLSLDSDAILKRFYEERGMSIERSPRDNAERLTISVKQKEESHKPMFILAIMLILALAIFFFVAKQKGWLVPPVEQETSSLVPADAEFAEADMQNDSALADSLIPAIPPQPSDSTDAEMTAIPAPVSDPEKDLSLKLTVVTDSVWVQVFCDGVSWKNVVKRNQSRDFVARDSFNIHIGNVSGVKVTLNSRRVPLAGKGVSAFKIDRKGKAVRWSLTKWNTVFDGRI